MMTHRTLYIIRLLICLQWVLVSLTSCHSMYGVFENGTQTFRVNPDHTFSWSWSSHAQYLFSDGIWWQERDSNQQQVLYHFTSNVTNVNAFKSEYGIFIGGETTNSRLKVNTNNTFVWEWNTDTKKNYSDGFWTQQTDSDALWLEANALLEKDYVSDHEWDSVLNRADELEWILSQNYKDIQSSQRFHFESKVKDIHKFPMYVKEKRTGLCRETTFCFSNLIFFLLP